MVDDWLREEVFGIAWQAKTYRHLSLDTLDRCVFEALKRGKGVMWWKALKLKGVMTWAHLPRDKVQPFLADQWFPTGDDWDNEDGELWIIDFIAPYGEVPQMAREAQAYFADKYGDGAVFQWKRTLKETPKMGFAVARKNGHELSH